MNKDPREYKVTESSGCQSFIPDILGNVKVPIIIPHFTSKFFFNLVDEINGGALYREA